MVVCRNKVFWLVRRTPYGVRGNLASALDVQCQIGDFAPHKDFIKRPIVGVYSTYNDALCHPQASGTSTAWAVIKRLWDPGWDYLPRLVREVFGAVRLDEDNEEYVEAVLPNELAARLFVQEWDAAYDWRNLTL